MSDFTDNVVSINQNQDAPEPTEEDVVAAALADETDGEEIDDDSEEIEFKGEKTRVPKAIAERVRAFDKDANWKMMQAAEKVKAAEAKEASFAETQRTFQAVIEEVTELRGIDKQLAQYKDMTPAKWLELDQQDPDMARKHQLNYSALLTQRGQIAGALEGKVKTAQEADRVSRETSSAEARKAVQAAIKDWSPAMEEKLKSAATEHYKASAAHLSYIGQDAVATSILNDAIKYRTALAKAQAKVKTASDETKPEIVPVQKVGGTATAKPNLEKMSGDQYREYMLKQAKKSAAK
ncbi:hypothetical protein UFOVP1623_35 [uncultured Caudovirales phage]|uniref:Uncharacterized protein n=1 Tax=uncultured Caudovirales phage TaxID=2100421 RepID=A0A6J5RZE2_9CAUD|nr:hypothetical protein UFOVP1376_28 [uncultured Caudovirales phage]CAB4220777.1 hypothetical protein UFOVP1623_35 [uncultured Caudovirales phage]